MLVAVSGYSKDQLAADAIWRVMVAAAPLGVPLPAPARQSSNQRDEKE